MGSANNYYRGITDNTRVFQNCKGQELTQGQEVFLMGGERARVHAVKGKWVWVVEDRAPTVVRKYQKRQLSSDFGYRII